MNDDWVIGIDLGASKISCALVSPQNDLVARAGMETRAGDGPAVVTQRIGEAVRGLLAQAPPGVNIERVGVCSPGPLDHESGILYDPPNLTGWRNVPFAAMLSEQLGLSVQLEHDAKATALAEYHLGAGRGARSMALIIVGTGIGAAIVLDGKLYRGQRNSAGEVGHVTVDLNGPICTCGSNGCVESYAGGPAIMRAYTYATRIPVDSAAEVAEAALRGDAIAQRVFQEAGRALGAAIATVAMLMDVDTFVLFGGVAKAGDLLFAPARAAVPKYSYKSVSKRVQIKACQLCDDAGVVGAALVARQIET
ncbi:MAG: ROK family protein [Terriglobia bacterium]|jgi:glucokinase